MTTEKWNYITKFALGSRTVVSLAECARVRVLSGKRKVRATQSTILFN